MDDQVSLKDQFVELMDHEKKTLHFFSNSGSRHLRAEGYDPMVDLTEQTIAEAKRRIAMYEALIKSIDEA